MTPIALKGKIPLNVEKFLMLITNTEGTDKHGKPYNCLYSHQYFEGFKTHPNKKITAGKYTSTAAGRYQVLKTTYDDFKKKYPTAEFTPEWQDEIAMFLLRRRGAYQLILEGKFKEAILKCNKEWASLPGSPYGQPTHSMEDALKYLNNLKL